jgi:beta-glucosidase
MTMGGATENSAMWDRSSAVAERVEALLQQMTLEEKIDLVTGDLNFDYGFYNAPIERVGIPALTMADGPAGVRVNNQAVNDGRGTAMPAPIALAATWDPDLSRRHGDVLGAEAFATGHNVQLAPGVDIARVAVSGRTFESFGEDPLLQARMVVPEIQAIQAHPIEATVKHYVANNQEYQRATISAEVDERSLQEIYLPPFEAAVREGHVAAVMGAFNKVNGTYACENRYLLTNVLREQLGFQGWVMSDYGANHSTAESANAGLDQEQPSAGQWGPQLLEAVRAGDVSEATIEEMVRRILRPMVGLGLLDRPVEIGPLPVEEHGRESREIAEQGIVLLKNADGLLPLQGGELQSIAVIGPDANNISAAGGGSGLVKPTYAVSPLEGIRRRAGDDVRVEYAPGIDPISTGALLPGPPPVPSAVLTPADGAPGEHGLRGEYWDNPSFEGEPSLVRTDPQVDLNLGFFNFPGFNASSPKLPSTPTELNGQISVRWSGSINAPASGEYVLSLTSLGTARLYLDDQLLISSAGTEKASSETGPPRYPYGQLTLQGAASQPATETASVHLAAGEPREVRIEHAADTPEQGFLTGAQVRFGWQHPEGAISPSIAEAVSLAGRSDVAIVVARTYDSEQMDRPDLRLPNGQDELIRAVADTNPRTIVVLTTGGPVETAGWEDRTPAMLEAWYAGQEQGNAIARVLFGDVNPSGKLPITFPRSEEDTPISTTEQYPGTGDSVRYTEGVFVGYRGYDRLGIEPQYPFGHGLSYTSFDYDNLRVDDPQDENAPSDGNARVSFDVVNTGSRAGIEVVQVYVGELPTGVPTPPRQLAAFARVALEAGERQRVAVTVARRSLSYWDEGTGRWERPNGSVPVYVGTSSRDIRLSGTIVVR